MKMKKARLLKHEAQKLNKFQKIATTKTYNLTDKSNKYEENDTKPE